MTAVVMMLPRATVEPLQRLCGSENSEITERKGHRKSPRANSLVINMHGSPFTEALETDHTLCGGSSNSGLICCVCSSSYHKNSKSSSEAFQEKYLN